MSICRLAAAVAATLLAASCGGGAESGLELTAKDSGERVTLGAGERLTVTLESNATTGYSWALATAPDAAVLRLVGSEYVPPEDGLVGEGGVEVWTFEGVEAGTTALELAYARPFEPGEVADRFELAVAVE